MTELTEKKEETTAETEEVHEEKPARPEPGEFPGDHPHGLHGQRPPHDGPHGPKPPHGERPDGMRPPVGGEEKPEEEEELPLTETTQSI